MSSAVASRNVCGLVTAPFTQEMGRNLAPFFDLKSEAIGKKKQHIEAFGAGRLVIRAWYFYCNPRVIIDKARLSQMTLERFLIFQYRFTERRSPVYVVPPSTRESRIDSNALSSIEQMKRKNSSSSLKLNEMKALFVVTASFDI